MAFLGTLYGCRYRLFRTGGPQNRSRRPEGSTHDSAAVACRHTDLQSAAGHTGRGHQLFAAGMAGRRCLHPSGLIRLFFHLFHFSARPADDFSGWRHAALQWEYAYSQSAGCHHVRAGCGIQFLSDFPDTRMQRCRHTVHPSGRRTGCERCRPGYGCRRDRRCRCAALVSADALGETELPQP